MDNGKKKLLMLLVLVMGCIIISFVRTSDPQKEPLLQENKNNLRQVFANGKGNNVSNKESKQQGQLLVQINGAVLQPGKYLLPKGARAEEAIMMAGGFLDNAASDKVNLARKLKDGTQITVPFKKEAAGTTGNSQSYAGTVKETIKNNSPGFKRININTATQNELEQLPGIGAAMAQRIISQRTDAPFRKVEDLLRVKGIGNSKLERLKDYVSFN